MNDYPGTFVTIEGIDGAGKTTVMEALRWTFGHFVETSEPSPHITGDWVYEAIQGDETAPLTDFYLYMADRAQHIDRTIKPALEAGELVVSDRYADSTRAYQYHALKQHSAIPSAERFIESTMRLWNVEPDLTIYLDVPVDTAMSRVDGGDKYEKRDFLRQVRTRYLELADEHDRIVMVDTATKSPDAVRETVTRLINHYHE